MEALLTEGSRTRNLIGKVAHAGWRPSLLGWGISSALVALAWAFVFRFWAGTTTLADFAALAPCLAIAMQYVQLRGKSSADAPAAPMVNPAALV